MKTIEERVIERVTELQGCKMMELCADSELVILCKNAGKNLPDVVGSLVVSGQLIEVEYVLPDMNYRAKSFILPANAAVKIIGVFE